MGGLRDVAVKKEQYTRSIVEENRRVCQRVNGKRVVERWQGSEVDLSCRDRRGTLSERFGSNQKAGGNLCDFRAISWEVEEVEVGERGRTTRKAENADYHE